MEKRIGAYALQYITPALITEKRDKFAQGKTKRKAGKRTPATVNRYLAALSHLFTVAYKGWNWINENPFLKVSRMKEPKGRIRFLLDDERFAQGIILAAFADLNVEHYTNPEHFLNNAAKYSKDTKICLDKNFAGGSMDGVQLAKELHNQGFTKLYIVSGENSEEGALPDYLKAVPKIDIGSVRNL